MCYCLGITAVDPSRMAMLFERFISRERNEPPDIDVDFEHERREEVIQYIYRKYGRERAALAATVICYRPRSALRDVGKALGLDLAQVDRLAQAACSGGTAAQAIPSACARRASTRTSPVTAAAHARWSPRTARLPAPSVAARRRLRDRARTADELVPVENAAMPERTVIQWDKDDLDALGLLKVDVLALGHADARIRRAFDLVNDFGGDARPGGLTRSCRPKIAAVYDMICRADTVGRVPDRVARADGDAAAPEARATTTTW